MTPTRLYTRDFWVACAIHVTGGMSLNMFVLFPLFVKSIGGNEVTIGLLLGIGTAASVAARPVVGALLDRRGRRQVLLWGGALNALSFLPFLGIRFVGTALYVSTIFHEVMWGWLFAAYFTYAADLVPTARRAEGIAIFGVAGMLTSGLGPVLGEQVIARSTYPVFFVVAAAFATASLAVTVLVPRRPPAFHAAPSPAEPGETWRLVTQGGLGRVLAASVLLGAGINAAFFFVAPFTRELGLERAAPFFAAYCGTSVVIRILGRRLLDDLGPHRVALPAFLSFAVGLAGLGLLPWPGVLVVSGVACGAGHGALFPVLNALAIARTAPRRQGTVVGLYTAALDLGGVVGIPICGVVAEGWGYPAMFGLMAAANVAACALMASDRAHGPVVT